VHVLYVHFKCEIHYFGRLTKLWKTNTNIDYIVALINWKYAQRNYLIYFLKNFSSMVSSKAVVSKRQLKNMS
jgi:hypothetical protein